LLLREISGTVAQVLPLPMYSLRDFGEMISDPGRFGAYVEAIAAAVRPGATVAEIGAGTGVFSLLACKAGARRVFAIEVESSIQFARELAAANGFSDRIEFFESSSLTTELPERVDLVVSDIRGALPLFGHAVPALEDARTRFLAAGGIMVPLSDTLKVAVVEAEQYYSRLTSPWQKSVVGINLLPLRLPVLNQFYTVNFNRDQLLTQVLDWGTLDYTIGASARVAAQLDFCAERNAAGHGICLWFDTKLFGSIGFSSAPGTPGSVYGQMFLPWLEPVALQKGEHIHVALQANLVGDDYVWQWETIIPAAAQRAPLHFRQSTFEGAPYSARSLHRQALDFVPALSPAGQADLWMLEKMNGSASLREIAQLAAQHFPGLFPSWYEAFRRAASLSSRFAR